MRWFAVGDSIVPVQERGEATPAFIFGIARQYKAYVRSGGSRHLALPARPVDMRRAYWPGVAQLIRMSVENRGGIRGFPRHMEESLMIEPPEFPRENQTIKLIQTFRDKIREALKFPSF